MRPEASLKLRTGGYSIDEVASLGALGKRSNIYKLIASGALKARKCGKRTIIMSEDILAAVDALPVVEAKNAAA